MPEFPSPGVSENSVVGRAEAVSPETIETVLADFRTWLQQTGPETTPATTGNQEAGERIDLHTLLGQFVALRHDVNLQTKATRAQQEQSAETLRLLTQALEALERNQALSQQTEQSNTEEVVRPLLKALVDLYDALSLARREVQRVQSVVLPPTGQEPPAPDAPTGATPKETTAKVSWWSRLFGSRQTEEVALAKHRQAIADLEKQLAGERDRRRQAEQSAQQVRQAFDSIITGYTMSLQRVERALQQQELEPIPSTGQPFDPERMEVLEAVDGTGRPAGEVVEEVRRGYVWHGRIFRYAQVRVAKS
jgi:molecular chaperone GrpE